MRCRGITQAGVRCQKDAIMGDFCFAHFKGSHDTSWKDSKEIFLKCSKCSHLMTYHIDEGKYLRCHAIMYDNKINDSIQCECRVIK